MAALVGGGVPTGWGSAVNTANVAPATWSRSVPAPHPELSHPSPGARADPDDWFPVARGVAKARDDAAHAIAVCARCPVCPDCLELSMRNAFGIGAHGAWGGWSRRNDGRSAAPGWPGPASPNSSRTSPHGYGETSRWLSTAATPGAAAAAALAAAASCSECTCP